jgi:urease accessory protein
MSRSAFLGLALVAATPAFAHPGAGSHDGFAHGFVHPVLGFDHVLAMVSVGLWAGLVGGRAVWAWPSAFVAVMAAGAAIGLAGAAIPGVEASIALSVVALGLAVALRAPLPLLAGAALCGLFALAHGYAHGAELPATVGAASYVAGFIAATALLHAAGVLGGIGLARAGRGGIAGLAGGAVAATGLVLLFG